MKYYIYPGALVQLRDGSKAKIYATDGGGAYPIHGAAQHTVLQWAPDGEFVCQGTYDEPADIVGPWVELPVEVVRWAVFARGNYWRCFDTEAEATGCAAGYPDRAVVKLTGTLPTRDK